MGFITIYELKGNTVKNP